MFPPRRSFLALMPLLAQLPDESRNPRRGEQDEGKLPNGKNQKDEILKADHDKNIQDAGRLIELSQQVRDALEKNTHLVLALDDLKHLEEIEKVARRMRSRIRKY